MEVDWEPKREAKLNNASNQMPNPFKLVNQQNQESGVAPVNLSKEVVNTNLTGPPQMPQNQVNQSSQQKSKTKPASNH